MLIPSCWYCIRHGVSDICVSMSFGVQSGSLLHVSSMELPCLPQASPEPGTGLLLLFLELRQSPASCSWCCMSCCMLSPLPAPILLFPRSSGEMLCRSCARGQAATLEFSVCVKPQALPREGWFWLAAVPGERNPPNQEPFCTVRAVLSLCQLCQVCVCSTELCWFPWCSPTAEHPLLLRSC